ncbi:hypothetical protein HYY72_05040 [Candidatus Woesearchaeota archaeon]|nr:hypothetical protein [Candidatus Woesearchaeota archaeon]
MISKKSQADESGLPNILLFVIVAIVIMAAFFVFLLQTKEISASELCQTTAVIKARTIGCGVEIPLIRNLNCKTKRYQVRSDGVYSYNDGKYVKDELLYAGFNENQEGTMKQLVADEMHQCWKYLGRGQLDPFGDYGGASKCVKCSQIDFDSSLSMKYPHLDGFQSFLQQNYVVDEDSQQRVTYWSYLAGGAEGVLSPELNTESQSVLFVSLKPDKANDILTAAGEYGAIEAACRGSPKLIQFLPGLTKAGGYAFAVVCKGKMWFGRAVLGNAACEKVEPTIVAVRLVPTAEVGKECDTLVG